MELKFVLGVVYSICFVFFYLEGNMLEGIFVVGDGLFFFILFN